MNNLRGSESASRLESRNSIHLDQDDEEDEIMEQDPDGELALHLSQCMNTQQLNLVVPVLTFVLLSNNSFQADSHGTSKKWALVASKLCTKPLTRDAASTLLGAKLTLQRTTSHQSNATK